MASLARLLNALAGSSELGQIGTAAWFGTLAAVAHVLHSSGHGASSDIDRGHGCEEGRQIIVLSHREPCIHDTTASGVIVARRPAGGLVAALEPVVRRLGGVWVAHGSGSADQVVADRHGHVSIGGAHGSYLLRRVWLTADEERGYYRRFANEGLWPLCHRAFSAPLFRRADWNTYQGVNRRFAEAVVSEIRTKQPIVLVQDYHFALVPRQLRALYPNAVTVAFWHIPWPNADQFSLCPHAADIVDGLLGSDIVGFQTAAHCEKFLDSVEAVGRQRRVDRERNRVIGRDGRFVEVRSYPISVEWPNHLVSQTHSVDECRREVRRRFGIDPTASLVLSVDRLDYTKGFEERFAAIERLFETLGSSRRRIAFLQIAAPTRVGIERYGELALRVRNHVARINQRFGDEDFAPVTYVERYNEPVEVFRCYRAADVCYVGSLDDGMNLVAKEFVAARDDEGGALVLSQFAGAARELADAIVVNPFDVDGVAESLAQGLRLSPLQQQTRMRALRRHVAEHNIDHWASAILADAERLRGRRVPLRHTFTRAAMP